MHIVASGILELDRDSTVTCGKCHSNPSVTRYRSGLGDGGEGAPGDADGHTTAVLSRSLLFRRVNANSPAMAAIGVFLAAYSRAAPAR
jgi:hypothetical protein